MITILVMQMKGNSQYWQERSEILQESLLDQGDKTVKQLERSYRKAFNEIEKEINAFYGRFANENGIDYSTAKRILNSNEIKKFKMELEDYIENGRTLNYSRQWARELENASTAHRITRLKMLEIQIKQQIELLYGEITEELEKTLANIYEEGYYRQLYELEQGTGLSVDFTKLDAENIKSIIHQSWAIDGVSFSDRVWRNQTKLVTKVLDEVLPVAFIRGETSAKTIRKVKEATNNSWHNARRIVLTESAAYAARSTHDAYNKFDVEKYIFIATLGEKTCLRCGGLESMSKDSGGFPRELYKIGSTAPPLHPHCKCTTAPYFDDLYEFATDEFLNKARATRDEDGKTTFIPPTDYITWAQEKGILTKPTYENNQTKMLSQKENEQKYPPVTKYMPLKLTPSKSYAMDVNLSKETKYNLVNNTNACARRGYEDLSNIREFAAILSVETGSPVNENYRYIEGDHKIMNIPDEVGRYLKNAQHNSLIITHIHNNTSEFSKDDLEMFFKYPSVRIIIAGAGETLFYLEKVDGMVYDVNEILEGLKDLPKAAEVLLKQYNIKLMSEEQHTDFKFALLTDYYKKKNLVFRRW